MEREVHCFIIYKQFHQIFFYFLQGKRPLAKHKMIDLGDRSLDDMDKIERYYHLIIAEPYDILLNLSNLNCNSLPWSTMMLIKDGDIMQDLRDFCITNRLSLRPKIAKVSSTIRRTMGGKPYKSLESSRIRTMGILFPSQKLPKLRCNSWTFYDGDLPP